jgi:hypothetical protein
MLEYDIKFVSDLRQVGCFLLVLWLPSSNKTDRPDITEILLKVALNMLNRPIQTYSSFGDGVFFERFFFYHAR